MDWTRAQNSATVKLEWSRPKVEEWASVDFQTDTVRWFIGEL